MARRTSSASQQSNMLRWSTFGGMYIGYTLSILNRKSFSFVLPELITNLGFEKNQAGMISSSQNLAYTISKFVGGILCDYVNVKYLFCGGLLISGLLTSSLSVFQSYGAFVIILFLQGIFQGGLWPACAKMLKQNFTDSEFGTWYGVLNTGMNLACCLGPFLFSLIVSLYMWPSVFIFSGVSAAVGSVVVFLLIDTSNTVDKVSSATSTTRLQGRGTWKDLVVSPFMAVVSVSYFVIFMARTAALDWGQLYVIQELGHSSYVGSMFISSMELGGVLGSVSAGLLADRMVARHTRDNLKGTPRMTVAFIFVLILTASLHLLLFCVSSATSELLICIVGFLMGVGVYGPISIYGVMSMEASPVHLQSTAHALVSLVANVGAVMAGLPFSMVARQLNWKGAFLMLECMLVGVMALKVGTRKLEYKTVSTKKKMQ